MSCRGQRTAIGPWDIFCNVGHFKRYRQSLVLKQCAMLELFLGPHPDGIKLGNIHERRLN